APLAFVPLPRPQTLFVADALPEPTLVAPVAPVASAIAVSNAIGSATAKAILRSFIPPPPSYSELWVPMSGGWTGISQRGKRDAEALILLQCAPLCKTLFDIFDSPGYPGVSS